MTLREKLLLQLAKDPNYEGKDETEKALVKELKEEMAKDGEGEGGGAADPSVKAAARELTATMLEMFKTMSASAVAAAAPTGRVPAAGEGAADLDKEVAEATKNMNEEDKKAFKKAYRFSEFAKALYRKDDARVKALAEGVAADGGNLVPDEFRATLIQHLLQGDSFRRYATVVPMQGKLLEIPRLSADVSVYWGTENKAINTTSADFGQVQLTPFRLNAIIRTSRELFDDSAISIFDILRARFTARVADEENKVFLTGNGTTQPKGISQETLRSISAANALTPDHLTKVFYKLPEAYRATARWLINSRVMEHLENSKDSNGQYLYPSLTGDVKTLKGRPVFVCDYVPSSKIWFGDLAMYYIGDRQQITMDVSTEEGTTWAKFQVALRLIERVDGEVALTQAFAEINTINIH